jgi:hypothetical protein
MNAPNNLGNVYDMFRQSHQNAAKRIRHNKHILFDALDAKLITGVNVTFEGSGDSGGIESISLDHPLTSERNDEAVRIRDELLETSVSGLEVLECISFSQEGMVDVLAKGPFTIKDAIESIVYDALKAEHDGWENNDGAYGDIVFDTKHRVVTMEFRERATEYFEHEF